MKKATRQPMESTSAPPTTGPMRVMPEVAAAHTPKARPRSGPSKEAVMMARAPGTRSAPVAPCARRKMMSSSKLGDRPQSTEVTPKPTKPMAKMRRRP